MYILDRFFDFNKIKKKNMLTNLYKSNLLQKNNYIFLFNKIKGRIILTLLIINELLLSLRIKNIINSNLFINSNLRGNKFLADYC